MTPRTRLARRLLAPILAGAALLAGCGDGGDPVAEDGGADAPEKVVLVTYDSFALSDAAAAEFRRLTGAEIEVRASGDSGTMLTTALLAAGAPDGDVIFGIDQTLATRALEEDLLEPFLPAGADDIPAELRLDGPAGERLTPIDTGDVCVNLDRVWFDEHDLTPPTTLEQLADPAYRDLLVVESPVTSSPGLAFLIGTVDRYGEDGWTDYWSRLRANGVSVRPSWDDAYYSDYTVSGGDRPMVLSYASSPPAEVIYGEVDEPSSTVLTDSCTRQVEYAGVLRGAANPDLARRLVEFMVSDAWQRELPLSNFVFPVRAVEMPEEFTRWAERAEDPMGLPAAVIDENRDEWIEQWRDLME